MQGGILHNLSLSYPTLFFSVPQICKEGEIILANSITLVASCVFFVFFLLMCSVNTSFLQHKFLHVCSAVYTG